MAQTTEDAELLLRQRHRWLPLQDNDFTIRDLSAVTSAKEAGVRTLSILLASVALVSLLTGGIGIMNIMLVSVTERTREIGVRMAVGARRRDILLQFLVEALTLSLMGGALGVAIGVATAYAFGHVAQWRTVIPSSVILLAFLFSGCV